MHIIALIQYLLLSDNLFKDSSSNT